MHVIGKRSFHMFDYLDSFQVYIVLVVIYGTGIFCSFLKMFNLLDSIEILRAIRIVCYSGWLYHEVALIEPSVMNWSPLLVALLTQIVVHLLSILPCFLVAKEFRYQHYLDLVTSYSYYHFASYGVPLVHFIKGKEFNFIPTEMFLIQSFFLIPIHTAIKHHIQVTSDTNSDNSHEEESISPVERPTEMEVIGEKEDIREEEESTEEQVNLDNVYTQRHFHYPLEMAYAVLSPMNICALFGLIFHGTPWELPLVLETFAGEFQKGIYPIVLFLCGVISYLHPLIKGANVGKILLNLLVHFVITPLISAFWCWALGVNHNIAQMIVMCYTIPCAQSTIRYLDYLTFKPNTISFTFVWSQYFGLPVFLIWLAIFNEAKLFG